MMPLNKILSIVCDATKCATSTARGSSRKRKAVYARVIFLLIARDCGYRDYEIMWHLKRYKSIACYYSKKLEYYKQSSFFNKSLLKAKSNVEI